jgi:hypothetical protein
MDGVEAGRIVEETLINISKQHCIDLEVLREEHRPILVALQKEKVAKQKIAENTGREEGRRSADLRHLYTSQREFGRITQGEDEVIDKVGIYCIIDSTIRLGGKSPSTINNRYIEAVQYRLMSSTSTRDVMAILEENRKLICESFGIGEFEFNDCLESIRSLKLQTAESPEKQLARFHEKLLLVEFGNRND